MTIPASAPASVPPPLPPSTQFRKIPEPSACCRRGISESLQLAHLVSPGLTIHDCAVNCTMMASCSAFSHSLRWHDCFLCRSCEQGQLVDTRSSSKQYSTWVPMNGPWSKEEHASEVTGLATSHTKRARSRSRTVIIAAVRGYSWVRYATFLMPLREHYRGDIVLLVERASLPQAQHAV